MLQMNTTRDQLDQTLDHRPRESDSTRCHLLRRTKSPPLPPLVDHHRYLPTLSLLPSPGVQQPARRSIHVFLPRLTLHDARLLGLHHPHPLAKMPQRYLPLLSNERQKRKNGSVIIFPSQLPSVLSHSVASRTAAEQGPDHHNPNQRKCRHIYSSEYCRSPAI